LHYHCILNVLTEELHFWPSARIFSDIVSYINNPITTFVGMDVLVSECTSPCQNTIAVFETWFALQREMLDPKIS
jgi:hypothetical protein